MATLAEIRAKLLEKEQRTGGSFQSDNAIYAFWNIPENARTLKVYKVSPPGAGTGGRRILHNTACS